MTLPLPSPVSDIFAVLDYAAENMEALSQEYLRCAESGVVSGRARVLTHDVLEKCSNALDQIMYATWYSRILPLLQSLPRRGGYFPAAPDEAAYLTALHQWRCRELGTLDPTFDKLLRDYQAFHRPHSEWIIKLRGFARYKHMGIIPQNALAHERRVVIGPMAGAISHGEPIDYGFGYKISEQASLRTGPYTEQKQSWVAFLFENSRTSVPGFCELALNETLKVVTVFQSTLNVP